MKDRRSFIKALFAAPVVAAAAPTIAEKLAPPVALTPGSFNVPQNPVRVMPTLSWQQQMIVDSFNMNVEEFRQKWGVPMPGGTLGDLMPRGFTMPPYPLRVPPTPLGLARAYGKGVLKGDLPNNGSL